MRGHAPEFVVPKHTRWLLLRNVIREKRLRFIHAPERSKVPFCQQSNISHMYRALAESPALLQSRRVLRHKLARVENVLVAEFFYRTSLNGVGVIIAHGKEDRGCIVLE